MAINLKTIKKLDRQQMYDSIDKLYLQCQQVLNESNSIKIPKSYKSIKNVVISGMGGSIIGGHIIKSIFSDQIKVPIELSNNYTVPNYVNKDTLCIISSYSGSTEETVSALKEAKKKKAKILIITSGGKLKKISEKNNIPGYIFNPKHNKCGEPRIGLGYSIFGQLILLKKSGIIKITNDELKSVIDTIDNFNKKFNVKNKINNAAISIAKKIHEKIPVLVGSEFLMGNIHTFNNQINENAKNFSTWMEIPEINHHLLEGLKNPKTNKQNICFVFIKSKIFHKRNQSRYKITQNTLKKNKIKFIEYKAVSKTKISQSFEILVLGSYISFYASILYGIDPSPVPYVDYFKKEINKA